MSTRLFTYLMEPALPGGYEGRCPACGYAYVVRVRLPAKRPLHVECPRCGNAVIPLSHVPSVDEVQP